MLHIYDDKKYILKNCYQHQMYKVLSNNIEHYEEISILNLDKVLIEEHKVIFSSLKLRNYPKFIQNLSKKIKDKKIFVHDEDPWTNYIDNVPCNGYYELLKNNFNVTFINTSKWWADYNNKNGYQTIFSKMWILPEYCNYGVNWNNRKYDVCFIGTLYDHRKIFFDKLKKKFNINVLQLSSINYMDYLSLLRNVRFFINEEKDQWTIKGDKINCNSMWTKQIEVASQGCIAIRNYESECIEYDVPEVKNIITYQDILEIPHIIRNTENYDFYSKYGVSYIKEKNYLQKIVDLLKE